VIIGPLGLMVFPEHLKGFFEVVGAYATFDLEMKRRAIEQGKPLIKSRVLDSRVACRCVHLDMARGSVMKTFVSWRQHSETNADHGGKGASARLASLA
jgi:hypothetical protein